MMRVIGFVLTILALAMPLNAGATGAACGTERWNVKTLTDPAASTVDFTPKPATVEQLTSLQVPGPIILHTPRYPAERQTYQISAGLVGFKLETDSDIHVVISGPSGATMIAEIPDPGCIGTLKQAEMRKARTDFIQLFGQPTKKFTRVTGSPRLTVTGVLFFDLLHGQTGVAKNGVELHPVLEVK